MADACNGDGRYFLRGQSNKNYVLTHGVSGVDWRFYKHPLPASVYDVYLKYGRRVFSDLSPNSQILRLALLTDKYFGFKRISHGSKSFYLRGALI